MFTFSRSADCRVCSADNRYCVESFCLVLVNLINSKCDFSSIATNSRIIDDILAQAVALDVEMIAFVELGH